MTLEGLEHRLSTKWLRGLCKPLIYIPAFDAVLCIQPCVLRRATPYVRDYSQGAASAPGPSAPTARRSVAPCTVSREMTESDHI